MRVFVAGGSGVIGRYLVPMLVAGGHDVVASAQSAAKLAEIESWGAKPVAMNGLDRASVKSAVTSARPDVVVHQMTALAGLTNLRHFDREFGLTNRLRTEGTHNLLDAGAEAGVRRLVAQSFTGWTNVRDGGPIKDEASPLDPHPPRSMRQSLDAIAELERAVTTARDVEGLVLRYGQFYGPGAPAFLDAVVARKLPIVGNAKGLWSFIHVADAAEATLAAIDRGTPGLYNVVDDEPASAADWVPYLAEVAGGRPPMHAPAWIGRLVAGEAVVTMMTEASGSSNAKAKAVLGWAPRHASWREGFQSWVSETLPSERLKAA